MKDPGRVEMTVKGYLGNGDKYTRWEGDAYELALIHTKGYGVPERPFMANAKKRILDDPGISARVAKKIKAETKYYKRAGEWRVRWDKVGEYMCSLIRSLMKDGKLGLRPLSAETERKRERYGYYDGPLYASGGLADCITYEVM